MRRRVVVTGFGAISPLGPDSTAFWDGLCAGQSGLSFITTFDTTSFPVKVAGNVTCVAHTERQKWSRTYRLLQLAAVEAAKMARVHSILPWAQVGIYCGRSIDWPTFADLLLDNGQHETHENDTEQGPFERFAASRFGVASALLGHFSQLPKRDTLTIVVDGACASGGITVGEAYRHIQAGRVDVAMAGAASSWINPFSIMAYHKLNALSTESQSPAEASRPFDALRSGFVMAEGAGAIILEHLDHAVERGVTPLAEITGYGVTTSAYRITDLPPDGTPQLRAMQLALNDAQRSPAEVDYINAHGTSTYQNDLVETKAIRRLLGSRCRDVPISSNKSMIGHTITAAGLLEAIATVCTIMHDVIPPTINLTHPDPECDLDYVPNVARQASVHVALSNSFGFGGQNCTLVIEAFRPERVINYD